MFAVVILKDSGLAGNKDIKGEKLTRDQLVKT